MSDDPTAKPAVTKSRLGEASFTVDCPACHQPITHTWLMPAGQETWGPIAVTCPKCGSGWTVEWSFQDQDIPFRGLTLWQALDQWCREHDLESHHDMDDIDREEFELAYYGPREEQGAQHE